MKKFSENQVFTNFLKAHPRIRADFFTGSAFYNENIEQGVNVESGTLSLYQYNVNRAPGDMIYPFVNKDAAKNSFSVTAAATYSALNPGAEITGSYPLTSSIVRNRIVSPSDSSQIKALKTSLNYYRYLSPYYDYSTYYQTSEINLISIPSIFYGETIKKGTVKLSMYYTGTLVAQAEDRGYNGALIHTYGTASLSGTTIGTVLYNEGFILITSSAELATAASAGDSYDGDAPDVAPKWIYFGPWTGTLPPRHASFVLEYEGQNTISELTMMAEAGTNEYNFSNNPTFITSGSNQGETLGTDSYIQASGSLIKNIVKSDFVSGSEPYKPVTYISKVGIYDDRKNLIAMAKLARPVRKRPNDSYTFKIKLDM